MISKLKVIESNKLEVMHQLRDAIIMCFINGSTSILAGIAVFSILGYMSVIANKNIAEIVKPGSL